MPHPAPVAPAEVRTLRAFNRFYTQRIGVLKRYLDSDFTLTEVRVLYEIAHRPGLTASTLVRELQVDAGYLSRMLRRFAEAGWLQREPAPADARQALLSLTEAGYAAFAPLQQKSRDEAAALLAAVPGAARPRLLQALDTVHRLLQPPTDPGGRTALRAPGPGDLGWVVQQHGEIYAREYGYDAHFEADVAEIAARILRSPDPERERGWIAEADGRRAGSVFVVARSATVAQLRLLVLRPQARGLGLGGRLVDECIAFARGAGYRKLLLKTHSELEAARALYAARGFRCIRSEPLAAYGRQLTSETWELRL